MAFAQWWHMLPSWSSSGEIFLAHVEFQEPHILCCCSAAPLYIGFFCQMKLDATLHYLIFHHTYSSCHPIPVITGLQDWYQMYQFLGIRVSLNCKMSYTHLSWLFSLPFHTDLGTFCYMSSLSLVMEVFVVAHIPVKLLVRMYLCNLVYWGMIVFPFCLQWWHVCKHLNISWVWDHILPWNYLIKEWMLVHLNRHFSLLSFRFAFLHTCDTFSNVSSWSLPHSSKPTIKMSSVITNTFDMPLNNLSIFFLNIPHTGAALNGSHMYYYLDKKTLDIMTFLIYF